MLIYVTILKHFNYVYLNRDNLLEEMLQEPEEVSLKRKRTSETLHVLQQAFRVHSYNLSTHTLTYIENRLFTSLYNRKGK